MATPNQPDRRNNHAIEHKEPIPLQSTINAPSTVGSTPVPAITRQLSEPILFEVSASQEDSEAAQSNAVEDATDAPETLYTEASDANGYVLAFTSTRLAQDTATGLIKHGDGEPKSVWVLSAPVPPNWLEEDDSYDLPAINAPGVSFEPETGATYTIRQIDEIAGLGRGGRYDKHAKPVLDAIKASGNLSADMAMRLDAMRAHYGDYKYAKNWPFKSPYGSSEGFRMRARIPEEYRKQAVEALKGTNAHRHNVFTLATALAYADAGLAVIDCHGITEKGKCTCVWKDKPDCHGSHGKHPRGAKWQERATTDIDDIVEAWRGEGLYPAAKDGGEPRAMASPKSPRNVGIAFDKVTRIFAVDIDGERGEESFAALLEGHDALPVTPVSISGSRKGRHILLRAPEDVTIKNSASQIAPGVDIRGVGGQIIAFPSLHPSGGFYEWQDGLEPWEVPVADAPEWMITAIEEPSSSKPSAAGGKSPKTGTTHHAAAPPRNPNVKAAKTFEGRLAQIGDNEDQLGFHSSIYNAMIMFYRESDTSEFSDEMRMELRDKIAQTILEAPKDLDRDRTRYIHCAERPSEGDYLAEQMQCAEEFVLDERKGKEDERDAEIDAVMTDAAALPANCTDENVAALFNRALDAGASKAMMNLINNKVVEVTPLGKRDVNAILKGVQSSHAAKVRKASPGMSVETSGFDKQYDYLRKCLEKANSDDPYLYCASNEMVMLRNDEGTGGVYIHPLNQDEQLHQIDDITHYTRHIGDANSGQDIKSPPSQRIMSKMRGSVVEIVPEITALATTPVFDGDGRLIKAHGYDATSRLYLSIDAEIAGLDIPSVPSEADVGNALGLIFDETFGDVPFDGTTRERLTSDPASCESAKNMLATVLMSFVRPMIDGPHPATVITKPAKGSGASLITEVCHLIATGRRGAARAFPKSDEEFNKEITGELRRKSSVVWYDNVKGLIGGPTLELLLTSTHFSGRLLGGNTSFTGPVTAQLIFTCNNASLTSDMMRRSNKVVIDALHVDPTQRVDFKHPNLINWVRANRPQLVWACLVLVQNWIAQGSPRQQQGLLASFESWHGIIGGIMDAAGLGPLKPDHETARAYVGNADDVDGDHQEFVQFWFDKFGFDFAPTGTASDKSGSNTLTQLAIENFLEGIYGDEDRPKTGLTLSNLKNGTFRTDDGTIVRVIQSEKRVDGARGWLLEKVDRS